MFHCSNINDPKIDFFYDKLKGKSRPNSVNVVEYKENKKEGKISNTFKSLDHKRKKISKKNELNGIKINISTIDKEYKDKIEDKKYKDEIEDKKYKDEIEDKEYKDEIEDKEYKDEIEDKEYKDEIEDKKYKDEIEDKEYKNEIESNSEIKLNTINNDVNTKSGKKFLDTLDPFKNENDKKCINFNVNIESPEYKRKSQYQYIKISFFTNKQNEKISLDSLENCKFCYKVIDKNNNDKDITNSILICKYHDKGDDDNNCVQNKKFLDLNAQKSHRYINNNPNTNQFTLKIGRKQEENNKIQSNNKQNYQISFYLIDEEEILIPLGDLCINK